MKHNLETLKKAIWLESFKEIRKEIEGFEKELRSLQGRVAKDCCKYILKEILG